MNASAASRVDGKASSAHLEAGWSSRGASLDRAAFASSHTAVRSHPRVSSFTLGLAWPRPPVVRGKDEHTTHTASEQSQLSSVNKQTFPFTLGLAWTRLSVVRGKDGHTTHTASEQSQSQASLSRVSSFTLGLAWPRLSVVRGKDGHVTHMASEQSHK